MNTQEFSNSVKALPAKTKIFLAAVVAFIIVATGCYIHHVVWAYNHSPEHTFAVLDRINTLQDVENASEYLTATGKRLLTQTVQSPKGGMPFTTHVTSKQIAGDKATFRLSVEAAGEGAVIADCLLIKDGDQWKFDDIWVETINGKRAEMLFSYMMDHPYKAAVQMVWQNPELGLDYTVKMVDAFVRGWEAGQLIAAILMAL